MTIAFQRRMFRFALVALLILGSVSLFAFAQSDRDGDGIPDNQDSCVNRGNEGGLGVDADGCPYYDADWDGVYDRNDACPWRADEYGFGIGSDGCPLTAPPVENTPAANDDIPDSDTPQNPESTQSPEVTEEAFSTEEPDYGNRDDYRDADWDGFPDSEDACPWRGNEGGLGTDETGCPYYDADWDGVYDRDDACPWRADEYGFGIDETGCPLREAVEITPEVTDEPTETTTPEITPEVTDEPTETATPEITPEITDEPTETATPEITPEVTDEPTETATPEVTDEPTETATPEITPEITDEPTETATPEITDEPTETPEPDSDGDGVSDDNDLCEGFDDSIDVDSDGIPDGCDDLIDSDDDGVSNENDQCHGFDDTIDNNNNNYPDLCEVSSFDRDGDGLYDEWEFESFGCVLSDNPGVSLLPDRTLIMLTEDGFTYVDESFSAIDNPVQTSYRVGHPYEGGDCAMMKVPASLYQGRPFSDYAYLQCVEFGSDYFYGCISVSTFLFNALDDPDGDGCVNGCEEALGTRPIDYLSIFDSDTDGDGLSDIAEIGLGTGMFERDTDGDGIWDGNEICQLVDADDVSSCLSLAPYNSDYPDYPYYGIWTNTNPLLADSDGDGIDDDVELNQGTDPTDADSDNDGVTDGDDYCQGTAPGTEVNELGCDINSGYIVTIINGEACDVSGSIGNIPYNLDAEESVVLMLPDGDYPLIINGVCTGFRTTTITINSDTNIHI